MKPKDERDSEKAVADAAVREVEEANGTPSSSRPHGMLRGDVDEILVHEFATSFNLTNYSLTRILFSCAIFPCVVHDSAEVNNNGN